ncbi:hypothetical protein [Mesonia sp. K4-1]|uniref:hypothetical protein n=1 Tax=Mesonia sp. K4-1 TaxID=2602760 RepID=UPI0011CC0047|nr:hypothetical protein [Mesonia sp. K4-1]TXK78718.1 hypothetical protein FT986_02680 [Mesonia sp. K4-1]
MTNVLKKITIGNPLFNLEMTKELKAYNEAKSDEEIANIYHNLLNQSENKKNEVLRNFTFAMIAFSTGRNLTPQLWYYEN